MFKSILKEERIAVLWLGELLSDIDQIPVELGQKIVIERASRPEVASQMLATGQYNVLVVQCSGSDFAFRYQWLREAVRRHPGVIRIMLNDNLQDHQAAKASELCHRSISFTATMLAMLHEIGQCFQAQHIINKPAVRDYVGTVERLPSIPSIYMELNDALASDAIGAAEIASIIEQDPAMTAKILQLVNSAFFALSSHVFKIKDAVVILGVRQLRDLFLVSRLFQHYPQTKTWTTFSFENLHSRGMVVGRFARAICRDMRVPADVADKAFLAALLQDIGMLVFATRDPAGYRSVMQQSAQMDQPLYAIEKLQLGVTHMEVGAYMLSLWNLPPEVVDAVLFHSFPNSTSGTHFTPLTAVHIADSLLPDVVNVTDCRINSRLSQSYIERLGLQDKMHAWQEEAALYANQLYAGVGAGF